MSLLDTALALREAGCSVIPVSADGTKMPAVAWKAHQDTPADRDCLTRWFGNGRYDGLGVVCGTVSGGLEMLEVESRALHLVEQLATLMADNGLGRLWTRLCTGYLEQSPSGGLHWLYRVDGEPRRNAKLARRPATTEELAENPDEKVKVLIETRGEGGYTVVAPSAGRTHPTGRAWTALAGDPQGLPTITVDERDALHAIANMLDEMPAGQQSGEQSVAPDLVSGGVRPGDDYNACATWAEILEPHGWQRTKTLGRGHGWTRPGKDRRAGISATTGQAADGIDRLYVFSSSTELPTETPLSKFAAYTLLEHGGDYSKAAGALRAAGYGTPPPEPPRPTTVITEPTATTYSRTDDGNALRLVDAHRDTIRYCPQRGQWLRWTGHRWTFDDAETVRELARSIARRLPDDDQPAQAHRRRSLSAPSIAAMVRLAQTDPRIVTHLPDLDARPYELNTPVGIIDLHTGKLHDPDPAALHTRATTVAPDDDTPAPRWHRFLADTFAGDPELTSYVQRLLGLSLIGVVLEQVLPFAFGAGANGKTTLLGAVQRIIGIGETGYAISAPVELLLASRNIDHPATIAQLSGARLAVTSELEDGQQFAEARVKQLTGGDTINARFMRQNPFTFTPTHTIWLHANHRPEVRAGGPAFWRRITTIPFLHTVPREQRDPHLEDRLVDEEAPAILAWLIAGARDYLTHGLAIPSAVAVASADYERDQDTIARFVDDVCETGSPGLPHMRAKVADIRAEYESWCATEGEQPLNPKAFAQALKTRFGAVPRRDMNTRYYTGIRVMDASPEEQQEQWWQR